MCDKDAPELPEEQDNNTTNVQPILIIGNGFDLECGLPTTYGDFLRFVLYVRSTKLNRVINYDTYLMNPMIKDLVHQKDQEKHFEDFDKNYWYKHFYYKKNHSGWIDFEHETSLIVRIVEDSLRYSPFVNDLGIDDEVVGIQNAGINSLVTEANLSNGTYMPRLAAFALNMFLLIIVFLPSGFLLMLLIILLTPIEALLKVLFPGKKFWTPRLTKALDSLSNRMDLDPTKTRLTRRIIYSRGYKFNIYSCLTYRTVRDKLLTDFNEFIKGFETYLRDYVGKMEPEITPAIRELMENVSRSGKPVKVICFNYTHTFERVYEKLRAEDPERYRGYEICHIHGEIGDGTGRNRMVLGIDEHLPPEERERFVDFVAFRKYYQRVYKETDNRYADWLPKEQAAEGSEGEAIDLHIFGHSLGITDRDVLVPLIQGPATTTTIYYHDDDAFGQQVANLSALLGMEQLTVRSTGNDASLQFVRQATGDDGQMDDTAPAMHEWSLRKEEE